eukprot:1365609-Amorphochlora_amoeboformis.AAC.1
MSWSISTFGLRTMRASNIPSMSGPMAPRDLLVSQLSYLIQDLKYPIREPFKSEDFFDELQLGLIDLKGKRVE